MAQICNNVAKKVFGGDHKTYYICITKHNNMTQIIAREKARKMTIVCNQATKTYMTNKAGGMKHSFEFLRHMIGQRQERDRLWAIAEGV